MSKNCNLLEGLKDCIDDVLSIPGDLGLRLHKVYFVTRAWSGSMIGDGEAVESITEVLPTPGIKDFSHNLRVVEGGAVKQGDIILTGISKNVYPKKSDVELTSADTVEKFYRIGCENYRCIWVKENQLTWDVQVRRLTDQTQRS